MSFEIESKYEAKWTKLARQWEKGVLLIRVRWKGQKVWERKGPANQVISQFSQFLKENPEYLKEELKNETNSH